MLYIGMDVHSKWTTVAVLNAETGELQQHDKVLNEHMCELMQALPSPKRVALEAGRNSFAIYDQLQEVVEEVMVCDPTSVRKQLAGEAKTDRRDAKALAVLLAQGRLKAIYVPDQETRELRELTRSRTTVVQMATRLKQNIRALLGRWGQNCSATDVLGQRARKELEKAKLPPTARQVMTMLYALLEQVEAAAQALEAELVQRPKHHAPAQVLMAIPGVGPVLALSMLAEMGDVRRFPTAEKLCGYSGLVPSIHGSGGRMHIGPLTKRGNRWLRTAAVMAAQQQRAIKSDNMLRRYYWRHALRLGPNPAKVATARKLLHIIYSLLTRPHRFVK